MSGSQSSLRRYLGAIKDTTTVSLAKVNSGYKVIQKIKINSCFFCSKWKQWCELFFSFFQELDIAIVKATNHVERPSKERYIRG